MFLLPLYLVILNHNLITFWTYKPIEISISDMKDPHWLVMKLRSTSRKGMAALAIRDICTSDELFNANCSGTQGRIPIDPKKLIYVKEIVFHHYPSKDDDDTVKATEWRECEKNIECSLRNMRNKKK